MYKLDLERFDTYKENNCLEVKKKQKVDCHNLYGKPIVPLPILMVE